MKKNLFSMVIAIVFLFTGITFNAFAQEQNVQKQTKPKVEKMKSEVKANESVKTKAESMKKDVKGKTNEGVKKTKETATQKAEQTKDKIKHHKVHKGTAKKNKTQESESK